MGSYDELRGAFCLEQFFSTRFDDELSRDRNFFFRCLDCIDQFTRTCSIGADFEKRYGKIHMKNHIFSHFISLGALLGVPRPSRTTTLLNS